MRLDTHARQSEACAPERLLARRVAGLLATLALLPVVFAPPPASATVPSTSGTEFWIAFPANASTPDALELFVASDVATTGTVTGGPLTAPETFTVAAGSVTTVAIPVTAESSGTGVQDIGLKVTTTESVSLYGISRLDGTSDAFTAIPVSGLGTRYRLASATGTYLTSIYAIIATEDGTTISIDGGADIALDEGETYVAHVTGDVSGKLVESSAPVSVLSGHRCSNFKGVNCDHMVEHLPPSDDYGTRFAVVRLANEDTNASRTKDAFKIIADRDGTAVSVDGVLAGTIDAGQSLVVEPYGLDGLSTLNGGEITTSEPALVVQYMSTGRYRVGGASTTSGDPSMALVTPTDQFRTSFLFSTMASGFLFDAVNVVVPTTAVDSVRLDGALVGSGSFTQLGSSDYSGAQLKITSGTHTLTADAAFGATVYGANPSNSYALPGGVGASAVTIPTAAPVAAPAATAVGARPVLDCDPTVGAGEMVRCRITGADADIDILWRVSATGSTVTEAGVRIGPDGTATFAFTAPDVDTTILLDVELVAWSSTDVVEVTAVPRPTRVTAGGGSGARPGWPLSTSAIVLALLLGVILRNRVRRFDSCRGHRDPSSAHGRNRTTPTFRPPSTRAWASTTSSSAWTPS